MGQPFVIQLDNRPGELAHVARALAARGISVQHIAGHTAGQQMCATVTTDEDEATRDVLRSMGVPFVEGDALHVEIEDVPGSLADLAERLSRAGVNISGIMVAGRRGTRCEVAITVDNEARAREVLGLPGVLVLSDAR